MASMMRREATASRVGRCQTSPSSRRYRPARRHSPGPHAHAPPREHGSHPLSNAEDESSTSQPPKSTTGNGSATHGRISARPRAPRIATASSASPARGRRTASRGSHRSSGRGEERARHPRSLGQHWPLSPRRPSQSCGRRRTAAAASWPDGYGQCTRPSRPIRTNCTPNRKAVKLTIDAQPGGTPPCSRTTSAYDQIKNEIAAVARPNDHADPQRQDGKRDDRRGGHAPATRKRVRAPSRATRRRPERHCYARKAEPTHDAANKNLSLGHPHDVVDNAAVEQTELARTLIHGDSAQRENSR